MSLNPGVSEQGSWLVSLSPHRVSEQGSCLWLEQGSCWFLAVSGSVTVPSTVSEQGSWWFLAVPGSVTVPSTRFSPCHEEQLTPMAAQRALGGQGGYSTAYALGVVLVVFILLLVVLDWKLCLSIAVYLHSEYCKRAHFL